MPKRWVAEEIRSVVAQTIPEGMVQARHNEKGHFYEVVPSEIIAAGKQSSFMGPVYPSVTGKLQILKDEGLINYKMNKAIEYVSMHWTEFKDDNYMYHLEMASRVSQDILSDAGDIGTRIHDTREAIFKKWIETGKMPEDFLAFIPPEEEDIRTISAMRGLRKFCEDTGYVPVLSELYVYSHKIKLAGALDDIGLMRRELKKGDDKDCRHVQESLLPGETGATLFVENPKNGKQTCAKCGYQFRFDFVLMDLKSSNQFKDHYFFQVSLYYWMFCQLTGLKPDRCFILKVSKTDGSYKIEDLYRPAKLAQYAMHMLKTNEAVDFIKSLRKDNQKEVATL